MTMGSTADAPLEISDDESESDRGDGMVSFMFGNVDKNQKLEADYMDEVRHGVRRVSWRSRSSYGESLTRGGARCRENRVASQSD